MKKISTLLSASVLLSGGAFALDLPRTAGSDPRVTVVTYQPNDVTLIKTKRGAVTRIVLEADEKITDAVTGLSSRCAEDLDEWCVYSPVGSNTIVVRPKDKATRNNLELITNKRAYSLEFKALDAEADAPAKDSAKSKKEEEPHFRVTFQYPKNPETIRASAVAGLMSALDQIGPSLGSTANFGASSGANSGNTPEAILKLRPRDLRNTNYTMQVMPQGEDAKPSLVFDDGRFTYFEYRGSRQIPVVFVQTPDGEKRVNQHFESNFIVVHTSARQFTIRLGKAVVGVWNESFKPEGIATDSGTVDDNVVRDIKQ